MSSLKKIFVIAAVLFGYIANCQDIQRFSMPIEYVGKPTDNGLSGEEKIDKIGAVSNISQAEMRVFLPKSDSLKSCVIIFPGGGYAYVNMIKAGEEGAELLAKNGIAAVVVKYRLPNGRFMVPYEDGVQAVRMVRQLAAKWKLKPNKIGVMGLSAGGHLAGMLMAHPIAADPSKNTLEQYTSRPDFCILIKAVYAFEGEKSSFPRLLGKKPTKEAYDFCNTLAHVNESTPPIFIVHNSDDNIVPVEGAIKAYSVFKEKNIPTEMHIFDKGGHGFTFINKNGQQEKWVDMLLKWSPLF